MDSSGMSGIGAVAEGVEFSDGEIGLRWLPLLSSMGIYRSIGDCLALHGHGEDTVVVWVDDEASSPPSPTAAQLVIAKSEIVHLKDTITELRVELAALRGHSRSTDTEPASRVDDWHDAAGG